METTKGDDRQFEALQSRIPLFATASGVDFIPFLGAVPYVEFSFGTRFYVKEERLMGVKAWLDGELVLTIRGHQGFIGKNASEEIVMINWFMVSKEDSGWLEAISRWTFDAWARHMMQYSFLVKDETKVFFHTPFWRDEETPDLSPNAARPHKFEYLPYIKENGLNLRKGEVLEDRYGIAWSILGAQEGYHPMIIAKNLESGAILSIMHTAFAGLTRGGRRAPREQLPRPQPANGNELCSRAQPPASPGLALALGALPPYT